MRHWKMFIKGNKDDGKSFTAGADNRMDIDLYVGSSKLNSHEFANIRLIRHENDSEYCFEFYVNDKLIRKMYFDNKTKEFSRKPIKKRS